MSKNIQCMKCGMISVIHMGEVEYNPDWYCFKCGHSDMKNPHVKLKFAPPRADIFVVERDFEIQAVYCHKNATPEEILAETDYVNLGDTVYIYPVLHAKSYHVDAKLIEMYDD